MSENEPETDRQIVKHISNAKASPVDYRLLLWKYILHIGMLNGSPLDPRDVRHSSHVHFTVDELDAFGKLAYSYAPPSLVTEK